MPFNQDYNNATKYFPAEQNWGTLNNTFNAPSNTFTFGGGDTTIINNVNIGVLTLSAVGGSVSSGSFVFSNSNGVSFGVNGSTITASVAAGGGGMTVSAGTESATGSLSFANSNGITIGMNASTVTFSYNSTQFLGTAYTSHTHSQYLNTSQSSLFQHTSAMSNFLGTTYTTHTHTQLGQAFSASGGSSTFQTLNFANSNGFTFSNSNGSVIGSYTVPTQTNVALSGSNGSFTFQTATFGNLNGLSFYTSNGSMVGSYTVPAPDTITFEDFDTTFTANYISVDPLGAWAGAQGVAFSFSTGGGGSATLYAAHNGLVTQFAQALSGSNGSFSYETATFGNLNGLSFYTSNGSMVGSYTVPVQSAQTLGLYASSQTTGESSSSTVDARSFSIVGAGNVSVGLSAGSFLISGGGAAGGIASVVVSDTTYTSGQISFVDGNGISWGSNTDQGISITHGLQYTSATSAITSAAVHTSAARIQAVYDGANSISTGTIRFTNANGVSFSINGQTVSGSIATTYAGTGVTTAGGAGLSATLNTAGLSVSIPSWLTTAAQSSQTLAFTLSGNSATTNSSQILNGGYALAGGNGVTIQQSNNTVSFSVATNYQSQGAYLTTAAQSTQTNAFSLGGNTGTTNSSILSAGGYVIAGGSNVTLSMSNNSLSIHAATNALTSQSNQALSGSNGSFTFQTATFGSSNGMHFYTTNGSMVGSYTVPTVTNSSMTVSDAATSGTLARLAFTNLNGVTLSLSTGAGGSHTIVGSHNALTSQSNQNVTAGNGGFAFQTLSFSNLNGISFGTSAGSAITASHNAITSQTNQTIGWYALGNTTQNSSTTLDARTNSLNGLGIVTVGYSNGSIQISATQSNQAVSNSAGSFTFQTLNFSNANNVTWGTSAGGIVTASVAAPGAAAENNWHHLLGANTAGNTTASGSTIGMSGINLTLSGTNGSVINISAPATSSLSATGLVSISTNGSTISIGVPNEVTREGHNPYKDLNFLLTTGGNGSLYLDPQFFPNFQFDRIHIPINQTNATNSSGSQTVSIWVGLYTRNGDTLSLYTSASNSTGITRSGTAGSWSLHSGLRLFPIPMTQTISSGRYWLAVISRTTSGGANASISIAALTQLGSNFMGHVGSSHNTTYQFTLGQGVYNTTTAAFPASIGFNQIRGSDLNIFRMPIVMFASSTV